MNSKYVQLDISWQLNLATLATKIAITRYLVVVST